MMEQIRCLYCGRVISEQSQYEIKNEWHKKCQKEFFGTSDFPEIDLSKDQMEKLANETVKQKITIPGVQKKLSLHLSRGEHSRLTIVDYPTGYILKPQTEEYAYLPEYEDLAMRIAKVAGVQTVPFGLIKTGDSYAYITKRIDRDVEDDKVNKYAMEDFCQLSNRLTYDKYRGSYEGCGRIIKKYSNQVGFDLSEMYLRILISFLIGNSDMHLKNFSLREKVSMCREYSLSAAYDIVPTNLILPEDEEEMALTVNGKKKNITKKDFYLMAEHCGVNRKAADKMMQRVCKTMEAYIILIKQSKLPVEKQEEMIEFMKMRAKRFDVN